MGLGCLSVAVELAICETIYNFIHEKKRFQVYLHILLAIGRCDV